MTLGVRRPVLVVHIICSVGWIGAAIAYLALGVAAQVSPQAAVVRAAWIGMELTGWFVIVPLGGLAFLTGVVLSLITRWGLLQHYWVVIALVLTTTAFAVLVWHMPDVSALAAIARAGDDAATTRLGGDVVHPALGILVLIVVAVINIYKPRGLTRRGRARQQERRSVPDLS
ncbi:MAG: DUF2269 domain-containing protein [Actinomycetes bacterium]